MADITAQALPSETLRRPATGWRALRRYPLFPLAILVFFLVIPAVFAPLVAPFDPYDGSLRARPRTALERRPGQPALGG